ncbi:MAG: rhodanese-like domain-containing protein [Paraclostridium sp.]
MKFINLNQVLKMIDEDKLALIIDVRDNYEYQKFHVPNAINIPKDGMQNSLRELYQYRNEPVLIYCSKGQRSATVGKYLEKKGFSNIYNLLNGIDNYNIKIYK